MALPCGISVYCPSLQLITLRLHVSVMKSVDCKLTLYTKASIPSPLITGLMNLGEYGQLFLTVTSF